MFIQAANEGMNAATVNRALHAWSYLAWGLTLKKL